MLYNFRKLLITKELKNYSGIDCIIICQNIIDFAAAQMFIDKGVKKIINCIDYIYNTKSCEEILEKGIDIIYIEAKHFQEFENCGVVNITNKHVVNKEKCFPFTAPENKIIDSLMEDFVSNTIDYMEREKSFINNIEIFGKQKELKPVSIIISRGEFEREDIRFARKIMKEENPSIICVDGGCDIALKYKLFPDVIVGDMDSISRNAVSLCNSFILHCFLNGFCSGLGRIPENKKIGFIKCFGTSEDAAILYCIKKGSTKVYTLGYHLNSLEFIEKGRKGMASSLLIRLYYGHIIRDIKCTRVSSSKMIYIVSSAVVLIMLLFYSFY